QRTDIQQMMREQHSQSQPQMQELMQKRMAFENATPGTAEYQTAAQQLGQAEAQAAQARVTQQAAMRTKIYNELTPEQRTKLASLRSERQTRMQKWRTQRAQHAVNKGAEAAPASTSAVQQ
ncbi:MAG: Spy/CpxP family protein refolding chaperone, partial [Rhodanobacteraceae bacterium]